MKPEDLEFHTKVLSLLKGIVNAYEEWLNGKKQQVT